MAESKFENFKLTCLEGKKCTDVKIVKFFEVVVQIILDVNKINLVQIIVKLNLVLNVLNDLLKQKQNKVRV